MIYLTLQERKVLLFLAFILIIGLAVRIYLKVKPGYGRVLSEGFMNYSSSEALDINAAEEPQWVALPGIGEKIAHDIIIYRQAHGPFKSVDELTQVKGIGKKKLEKLKGRLVVNK
ncbi:MAG: helix-hairpin-helix domain-containing protein [Candidatus Omnitrophota bacterium]